MPGSSQTMLQARVWARRSKRELLGICMLVDLCIWGSVKLCGYCRSKHNSLLVSPHITLTWYGRAWCKLFVRALFSRWGLVSEEEEGCTMGSDVCRADTAKCNPLVAPARGADTCGNRLQMRRGTGSQWQGCLGVPQGASASAELPLCFSWNRARSPKGCCAKLVNQSQASLSCNACVLILLRADMKIICD